jgi:Sec-independent protein secretion pathway component TatC
MQSGAGVPGIATHSGWVELGLAFGVPILALIFTNLCLSFSNALRGAYPAKMTILGIIILVFFLYSVGEVAIDHGLEILFFLLALISALMLTVTNKEKHFKK